MTKFTPQFIVPSVTIHIVNENFKIVLWSLFRGLNCLILKESVIWYLSQMVHYYNIYICYYEGDNECVHNFWWGNLLGNVVFM